MGLTGSLDSKESAYNAADPGLIPGSGKSLKKRIATHSSILAWEILWAEEPMGYSTCSHKESDMTEWLTLQN